MSSQDFDRVCCKLMVASGMVRGEGGGIGVGYMLYKLAEVRGRTRVRWQEESLLLVDEQEERKGVALMGRGGSGKMGM